MNRIIFLLLLICLPLTSFADNTKTIKKIGDAGRYIIPAAALFAAWYKEPDNTGVKQFLYSIVTSQAATEILKRIVREERPNGRDDLSFPSGHASAAFAGAAFLQTRYGWKYGVPAYAAAAFVAYSRVKADQHYTHDVVAGALLAIGVNMFFVKPYKIGDAKLALAPKYNDGLGLQANLSW